MRKKSSHSQSHSLHAALLILAAALLAVSGLVAQAPKAPAAAATLAGDATEVFAHIAKGDAAWLKERIGAGLDVSLKSANGWGLVGGCSVYIDDPEVYRLLKAKGADMSELCPDGYSSLVSAIGYGHLKAAAALLELGADASYSSKDGMSAIKFAAASVKDRAFLDKLCKALPKALLDAGDPQGYTPLQQAIASDNKEAFAALLDAGASVDAAPLPAGASPLHFAAAFRGRTEYLRALLARKAKLEARAAKLLVLPGGVRIENGSTPLLTAIDMKRDEAATLLLGAGADARAADKYGRNALHLAAGKDSFSPFVRSLLKADPSLLESRDKGGRTPLHIALMKDGGIEAIKLLLDAGASINALDNSGQTPLDLGIYACSDPRVVKEFIKLGGKVSKLQGALDTLKGNQELSGDFDIAEMLEGAALK